MDDDTVYSPNKYRETEGIKVMQVIDPTFRSYAMPGYNTNVYDPLSNILASIRYSLSRYGSLDKAWRGVGYAQGTPGPLPNNQWAWVGEQGPELVRLSRGSEVFSNSQSMRIASGEPLAGRPGNFATTGNTTTVAPTIHINVEDKGGTLNPKDLAQTIRDEIGLLFTQLSWKQE